MDEQFQDVGLDFKVDGYFSDLISRERPTARVPAEASPWDIWEHALGSAVHGDFSAMPRVVEIMRYYSDHVLCYNASLLLADAITEDALALLHQRMEGCEDPLLRIDYCRILTSVGRLEFVPRILEHLTGLRHFSEAEIISIHLSDMLEPKTGDICLPSNQVSNQSYRALVLARCDEIRKTLSHPNAPVLRGELFSVPRLARIMLRELAAGDLDEDLRRRFEASTGINCTAFYKDGKLRPLKAAAILEDFLADRRNARYADGVRYFFGRRIP